MLHILPVAPFAKHAPSRADWKVVGGNSKICVMRPTRNDRSRPIGKPDATIGAK
jgi:hypothetical protein